MIHRTAWVAKTLLYGLSGFWLVGCGGGSDAGSPNNTVGNPTPKSGVLLSTNITRCASSDQNDLLCNAQSLAELFGLNQDAEVQSGASPNYKIVQRNNQRCIEDAHTGLTWELKTTDTSIHNVDYGVYWYEPDPRKNGGNAGLEHDFSSEFAAGEICGNHIEYCNTHAFINKLNEQKYCGYSDWRLPSPIELTNLVNYGATTAPLVYAPVVITMDSFYWTAIPTEVDSGNPAVKSVSFFSGATVPNEILYAASAIAVRGTPFPSAP